MQQQLLRKENLVLLYRVLLGESSIVISLSLSFFVSQTRTNVRQTTEDVITTVQTSFPVTSAPVSLATLWTVMNTPAMVSRIH